MCIAKLLSFRTGCEITGNKVFQHTTPNKLGNKNFPPALSISQRFVLKLIQPLYERLGFDERPTDSHVDHGTRYSVIAWACSMGHKDCLKKSVDKFKQWMADPENPR